MDTTKRTEHDFLGEMEIPNTCYYGIQTQRAVENFKITDIPISIQPRFIQALGYVKKAAALANRDLNVISEEIAEAIVAACDVVISGKLDKQFVVDVIQGGAGTSTNMNANEVIANKALEILGYEKGRYDIVHPNNHVNCSQSTNDAYPTAFRIALLLVIPDLKKALKSLARAFRIKSTAFKDIIKMGRTQLQDAVPMSLGQEFGAFATTVVEDIERLESSAELFREINLGATAIGTGVNAPAGYTPIAVDYLRKMTGLPLDSSVDLIEATSDTGAYVQLSGVLKRIAVKLSKICNDLRLLSSGPTCGFNEINLPKMQPGSSIMPGKVNPVIPEVVKPGGFQGHRHGCFRDPRGRGRAVAAQCHGAGHRFGLVHDAGDAQTGLSRAGRPLRQRHYRQRGPLPRYGAEQHWHRHRAESHHRVREVRGNRQKGPGHRQIRPGTRHRRRVAG